MQLADAGDQPGAYRFSRKLGGPGKDYSWGVRSGATGYVLTEFEQLVDVGTGPIGGLLPYWGGLVAYSDSGMLRWAIDLREFGALRGPGPTVVCAARRGDGRPARRFKQAKQTTSRNRTPRPANDRAKHAGPPWRAVETR